MTFDRPTFFALYRKAYGPLSQSQVDGLNSLLSMLEKDVTDGELFVEQAAYLLATAKHETANTYLPITERGGRLYFLKYDWRKSLGNTRIGDGYRFRGRGFVQITGRRNYTHFGIADNPDSALEPGTAYGIMRDGMKSGQFGQPLAHFVTHGKRDFVGARRSVNNTDRAQLIAGYAEHFWSMLMNAQKLP